MSEINHDPMISELLKQMPKRSIPSDLVAAIEAATIDRQPRWWETETFRARWVPALVGLATAVGALWLSKAQENPRPQASIPVAAAPHSSQRPAVSHALLPKTESLNTEKGESREN